MNTICLIGSSRFKQRLHEVGAQLEKAGNLALMMSFFRMRMVFLSPMKSGRTCARWIALALP
jgi:hypothetical protein